MYIIFSAVAALLVVVVLFISVLSRYKRCPSDKILVIYGRVAKGQTAKCVHGGAAFVWPITQSYAMLDLTPIQVQIPLDDALSKQNIRVSVPGMFTIGISTKPEIMSLAAERLLGLPTDQIKTMAAEMITGQMRLVVATMDIEEINANREKFLDGIYRNVEVELEKIGLRLINVNIRDINDGSGYLRSLGQNAAAQALNDAKKAVAEKDRDGEIGQAVAVKEKTIKVAEAIADAESGKARAQQTLRINVATANSEAVKGENLAQITIANSSSEMRQRKAELERIAAAAEKVKAADALRESYEAERKAEDARAEREMSTKKANEIVTAEIEKQKTVIRAEADKQKQIKEAEGKGAAIFAELEGQAKGIYEILTKQAEGLQRIVTAAGGNADKAAMLLIIDKLPELVKTQVEAIKNVKIDKITVWDSGSNNEGVTSTAGFLQGLMKSVPPLNDLFKQAGLALPEILGKQLPNEK